MISDIFLLKTMEFSLALSMEFYLTLTKSAMSLLNLGLNAQQIINREQDKQDQQEDYQNILIKQEEIIQLNQEALSHIQKLEMQQQEQSQIFHKLLNDTSFALV